MKTVIVPVDFSDTSLNAAHFAAKLFVGHYGIEIILYHSYSSSSDEADVTQKLTDLKNELTEKNIVKMDILPHHESDFIDGLEKAVRHRKADLVVMGITGKSALAKVFFGSNTLKMVETKSCPVLIVPNNAQASDIKHAMLASDFKDSLNVTPSGPIKDFLKVFKPTLHIVNVDKDHYISLTENYEKEKKVLNDMFSEFNPEFYFMRLYDIDEALNLFAEEMNIDLIIAIHKHHSFIDKLLHGSRTKELSYHSKMPILVMQE
jgi:nucleotide-binding universal stress UspA family protein